jgi:cytochrome c oxidase subunit II
VTFTPRAAGRFTAICDHFCGSGHGNMHMELVVDGTFEAVQSAVARLA